MFIFLIMYDFRSYDLLTRTWSTSHSNKTKTEKPASVSQFLAITDQRKDSGDGAAKNEVNFSEFCCQLTRKCVVSYFFLDLLFDLKPVQYEFQSAISPYPAPAKGIVGLEAAWSRLEHWNMIRRRISTSITSSCNYHEHWLNLYVCGWNPVCLLLRLHQFYLHFEGETLPHIVWIISSPAINTL